MDMVTSDHVLPKNKTNEVHVFKAEFLSFLRDIPEIALMWKSPGPDMANRRDRTTHAHDILVLHVYIVCMLPSHEVTIGLAAICNSNKVSHI